MVDDGSTDTTNAIVHRVSLENPEIVLVELDPVLARSEPDPEIQALTTSQVAALTSTTMNALTTSQIAAFSTDQIVAITTADLHVLNTVALDAFTSALTKNYPLGIHADSVQVTDSGVVSQFSTQNASIPKSNDAPCFAGL